MRLDEGLTGWVARHRTPEFIRDSAMADPRMKFFPMLDEERFQSMVAVPILSRAGETIGVIVLHTEAPREFTEDTLKLLVHIASLVSRRDRERAAVRPAAPPGRRADRACPGSRRRSRRRPTPARSGARSRAACGACSAPRSASCTAWTATGRGLQLLSSSPEATADAGGAVGDRAAAGRARRAAASRPPARTLWPELDVADLLVTPLSSGGERVGLLCAGAPPRRPFSDEDTEMARAIAHLAAIAIKRAELIEGLTNANIVKDLFEALAAGATDVRGDQGGRGSLRPVAARI